MVLNSQNGCKTYFKSHLDNVVTIIGVVTIIHKRLVPDQKRVYMHNSRRNEFRTIEKN